MPTFEDFLIAPSTPIRQAMERMTLNARGLVLVCDRATHLVGVLTDGDTRRALLRGTLLNAPAGQWMNADPIVASTLDGAAELLGRHGALAVPVVDGEGQVEALVIRAPGSPKDGGEGVEILHPSPDVTPFEEPPAESAVRAVAVIPARGGSKRLPGKNLLTVGGRSLVARAVDACLGASSVVRTLVSTDDEAIAREARRAGAEVPWLRPAELATDRATSLAVLRHSLQWLREQDPDIEVALLVEPTAPLRTAEVLDRAIELLTDHPDATSVVSVSPVPHTLHPDEMLRIDDGHLRPLLAGDPADREPRTLDTPSDRRRQAPVWIRNGWVYAVRIPVVLGQNRLYGDHCLPLELTWDDFSDIDTAEDLRRARQRVGDDPTPDGERT